MRAVASPLPLPQGGSLSRNARRKPAPAPAPPRAPTTPGRGTCAIDTPHTDRASRAADRGAVCGLNRRRRAAPLRSRFPTARPTPHTRATQTRAARRGRGLQTPFPNFRLSPRPPSTNPERKAKEPESGDRRKDSTLRVRGWELPLPPEKLSHWLLLLPRTHPPSHLSLLHLPATIHSSRLIRQARKVGGERGGRQKRRKLRASKFKRRGGENPQRSCVAGTLGASPGSLSPLPPRRAAPASTLGAVPPAGPAGGLEPRGSAPAPASARALTDARARARRHPRSFLTHFKVHSQNS